MNTNERSTSRPAAGRRNRKWLHAAIGMAVVGLAASCWISPVAASDLGSAAKSAKRPLILIQVPDWTGDDHNWGGPYDGPSSKRMCLKILKNEAARLAVELTTDPKRMKECDGALSLNPQSPKADIPVIDVLFQGHRVFFDEFTSLHKTWDVKRKHYLLASTNDPEWLKTGLRLLKAAWQVKNARVCVVTDEAGAADSVHPQLGTTFHAVPCARLDREIRKVNDAEAAAVAADYMHQGRMVGTFEGSNGYQKMPDDGSGYPKMDEEPVDPVRSAKAKRATMVATRFYLACRNLLAAENCQALTLADPSKYGAAPVIAFSGLADNGIAAAFDRDATMMLLMAGALLERAGFAHGPLARQGANGFVASCFTCPTRLDGYDEEPPASFSIGPGAQGKGFGIQVRWRKGEEITRLQLKNSKVLMTGGKVCYSDIRLNEGYRTAVAIQLENKPGRPDPEAANCVIVRGNCLNEMSCLARLLDLDFPAAAGVLVPR